MKLTASPHFPEKRIGYLGMMLLLSEDADVLMLATNSLKNDMNSENRFVAGLALCAIGNLATADMSRDLAPEVDKHLKSATPYLRKKACLAMSRCLTKCPDMVEDFVERVVTLLKDKSHGVLITVLELMTQVLIVDAETAEEEGHESLSETPCRKAFLRLVPVLVKLLRNLLSQGYSPEYDVGGISDPFLQVQILTVFRLLGAGNEAASEEMNDVLAQVATNTETSKNAGNAILYECVQTIMAIESEDSLRVLAVNILGRFLLNRDNNIRYVALNTLAKCIVAGRDELSHATENANSAASALQRHRTTVVDCLKDPDVSIRQRALELIYHLVNEENVEDLTSELLNYLVLCPREHRGGICTRILRVVDHFSPDDRWRVDTLITMLTIAGRETSREVQSATIIYISRSSEDLRAYATHKLLKAIRDDDGTQRGLLTVGVWCIGEYGDLLLSPYSYTPSQNAAALSDASNGSGPVTISFMALDTGTIVDIVEEVTQKHSCPPDVKERALTCYAKLSDRFANKEDPGTVTKLQELLKKTKGHHSLEMQLRSCEYDALLNAAKGIGVVPTAVDSGDIFGISNNTISISAVVVQAAKDALARMPAVDLKVMKKKQASDEFFGENHVGIARTPRIMTSSAGTRGDDLLDLNDIFGIAPVTAHMQQNGVAAVSKASDTVKSDVDLLSDIFSAPPVNATLSASGGLDPFSGMSAQQPVNPMDLFGSPQVVTPLSVSFAAAAVNPMDLFGASPAQQLDNAAPMAQSNLMAAAPVAPSSGPVVVEGFSHQGLSVDFHCTKPDTWNKQKSLLIAQFKNMTDAPIYGLSMQIAVPKYVQMEMQPPTSSTVPQTGGNNKTVTQIITVANSMIGSKNLMLKIKVGFTTKGTKVDHTATCSGFTAGNY